MPDPFARVGEATLYKGDARVVLRGLPDASVNCVVTSPPYWSLRRYEGDEQEQTWPAEGREAEAEGCEHEWGEVGVSGQRIRNGAPGGLHEGCDTNKLAENVLLHPTQGAFCALCGSWRGGLGLEPTPALFVAHLISVFREVRRVLHPTGVVWCNLGDGYAASPGQRTEHDKAGTKQATNRGSVEIGSRTGDGLKPTDLVGVPFLVAQALRADGWYLRSVMPWIKPSSAMPESCRSRPSVSHEYWLMLTKQAGGGACWDGEAVRIPHKRLWTSNNGGNLSGDGRQDEVSPHRAHRGPYPLPNEGGRSFRTSDLFLSSLDSLIAEQAAWLDHLREVREKGGLLLDEDGNPLALLVNPKGFSGAKYLGDWSRKEWRDAQTSLKLPNQTYPESGRADGKDRPLKRRVDVWYIAAPDCPDHAHYHDAERWRLLGYAHGRVPEKKAECGCVEVTVDHFAAFVPELVLPLLKAGCPQEVCSKCGAPKVREVKVQGTYRDAPGRKETQDVTGGSTLRNDSELWSGRVGEGRPRETLRWSASCDCNAPFIPGAVLDPFAGACSTGVAAKRLGRRSVLIDCSADYLVMGARRLEETGPTGERGKVHVEAARAGQAAFDFDLQEAAGA